MSSGSGIENHRVESGFVSIEIFQRPQSPPQDCTQDSRKHRKIQDIDLASSSQKNHKTKKQAAASIDNRLLHKRNTSWRILRHTTMEMRGVRRKKSLTPNSRRRKSNFRQSLIPVGKRSKRDGGTRSRRGFNIRLILSHRARALFFYCC